MNLFQRINEVRKGIDYIRKDKSVSAGAGGSYKAVTHDMVTAMVRDHMVKAGIVSYPVLVGSQSLPFEVSPEGIKAKQFRYEATYDFHFVNTEDPKDELVVRIQAHAMDNADKAPGKALSYAKKYAILKLFEIETGEDEESRSPEEKPDIQQEDEALLAQFREKALEGTAALNAFFTIAKGPAKTRVWSTHGKALKDAAAKADAGAIA